MPRTLLFLVVFLLAGCSGGAVVFAPTPAPPDQSPARYDHPSGAFSVTLPRQWALYDQNTTALATAAFSRPGSSQPALLFAVINLGHDIDANEFGTLIDRYQATVRSDTGHYTEQSREAMGDGSWRMAGLRSDLDGETVPLNTFIQRAGSFVGVAEVVIPADAAQLQELQGIINSFSIHTDAPLEPTDLNTFAFAKDSSLGVLHVATWSTPQGVSFITGEVANYGLTSVSSVPVGVNLRSEDGVNVTGAVDQVMGYGIPPGGFAPFSLRFGQGQPSTAATYSVALGGNGWQPPAAPVIYGQQEMTWTDESAFDDSNRLVISGTVTNVSDHVIRQPRATVTVFDAAQNVIAAGYTDLSTAELAAGQSAPFSITLPDVGGSPQNYIVSIQGLP
jgi:hypothetical protein